MECAYKFLTLYVTQNVGLPHSMPLDSVPSSCSVEYPEHAGDSNLSRFAGMHVLTCSFGGASLGIMISLSMRPSW